MKLSAYLRSLLIAAVAVSAVYPDATVAMATEQQQTSRKKNTKKSTKKDTKKSTSDKGKGSQSKKQGASRTTKKGSRRKGGGGGGETSADVRRREQATQKEIAETRRQIQANDKSISQGMAELGRLQGDIGESKKKVKATAAEVGTLDRRITSIGRQVTSDEAELVRLRSEYLKAVKKMRVNRKGRSTLAFIFSSGSFSQALRRMRYLKEFSDWKDRKSADISRKVAHLKGERELLAKTKVDKDKALQRQSAAQSQLEQQYARQDALVADLRRNGEALNAHLARKQAEANELRNKVAALIAAEQRAAEQRAAEEARKAREAREAEEARLLAERKRREAEEAVRRADEMQRQAAIAKAEEQRQEERTQKTQKPKQEKPEKADKKKEERKKKETPKRQKQQKRQESRPVKRNGGEVAATSGKGSGSQTSAGSGGDKSYADARRRKPRGPQTVSPSASEKRAAAPAKASGSGFESMRGSLPRPVSGSFRITSPFGRHSLPELPDVVYDNPGIDAEVASGASAQSVYPGKVSGVYVIPGFNTVVIVSHGNYYTVYGNISSPSVKVGDSVKQGQKLGKLSASDSDNGSSSIHFEVWRNREKLNPAEWIR